MADTNLTALTPTLKPGVGIYQVMPDLSADDFTALKADISERGVMVPVEYDDAGNVLDGHHRIRACVELGVTTWPKAIRNGFSEAEKRTHARRLNIARRHLNQGQKQALIADELRDDPQRSNRQIAAGLGVDHKTVEVVRDEMQSTGEIPQLDKTIGKDGKARRKPIRTRYVDETPEGEAEAIAVAKGIRAKTAKGQRDIRIDNLARISAGNAELSIAARYPVIYADPPWRYEAPPLGSVSRIIENHYPTMTLDEICALPISDLAADDAILYIWATAPKLAECIDVIRAWDFEYRTCMVWDKIRIGMGYYARNQHELLLIARRGSIPVPAPGTQPGSVYREERGEHSAKPDFFAEMIEGFYPTLPKIELFCRSPRPGWAVWGNQSDNGQ